MKQFILLMVVLYFCTILCISRTQQSQAMKGLRQRFTKDIQRLNSKLTSIDQEHPLVPINIQQTQSPQSAIIEQIHLQQQNIFIQPSQLVQLNLQNIPNLNIINAKISPYHTQQSIQSSKPTKPKNNQCKFIDPQLTVSLQRKYLINFFASQSQQQPLSKPSYILFKTEQNKQRLLIADDFVIILYQLVLDMDNKYVTRSNINQLYRLSMGQLFNQQQQQYYKKYNIHLFMLQQKMILLNNNTLYEIQITQTYKFTINLYAEIQFNNSNDKQKATQTKQQQQDKQNKQDNQDQSQQQSAATQYIIERVIPLKYGFLAQYNKHIQIYLQSQQLNPQVDHKIYTPRLSQQHIMQLTNNQSIISIHIQQQTPSQHSGYQIFLLLQSNTIVQLQYGAYTNIFLYNIPYGQRFVNFAISTTPNKDIIQIVFELSRGKMVHNYVAQLFIQRNTNNPQKPTLLINRFYNDLTNVRDVQFINSNQLLLIGQDDTLILDYPISSQLLIKQKIQLHPYHFNTDNLLGFQILIQNQSQSLVLLIQHQDLSIVKMTRKRQSIQCRPQDSMNTKIQILTYCPSTTSTKTKQISTSLCKYITTINITVSDQQSMTLQQYKKYLIILLIIVLIIFIIVLIKQLIKNKNIINKLKRIKQSIINKKQRELKQKGQKVHGSQKFAQLHQQQQVDNHNNNK